MRDSDRFKLYESALTSLYETPTEPRAWAVFLAKFSEVIDARGGQYHLWDTARNRMALAVTTDQYPEKETEYYNTHLAPGDPRRKLTEAAVPGQWVFDNEHFDASFVDRNEVYQWLRPWDIRYAAAIRLSEGSEARGAMALFRSSKQNPFGDTEKEWLSRITPHVQRASELHLRFEALRRQAAVGLSATNALDYPLFIVDDRLFIRFANVAAESMLRLPSAPLRVRNGRLRGFTPSCHDKLTQGIRFATSERECRASAFSVQSDIGSPECQVVFLPINPANDWVDGPSGPRMSLVTLGARWKAGSGSLGLLRDLFGLSDAEAKLVSGLAEGSTLQQVSEQAGVSINTVRTQLQSVFTKTQTHRQVELIRLVHALPRLRR